jgi:hypothetical protein
MNKKVVDKLFGGISKETIVDFLLNINPYPSIRQFILKVLKGFRWFAFSWSVYWFDYSYIERTLAWLLNYMGKKFINDGMTLSAETHGKEMLYIADRLQKLCDGVIEDEIYKQHEMSFPNKPEDTYKTVKLENGAYAWEKSDAMKNYEKTAEGKRESTVFRQLHVKIEKAIQKERNEIYAYIAKHIVFWWD